MKVQKLHDWGLTPTEAIALQRTLAGQLTEESLQSNRVRLVAGVDVSSTKENNILTAGVVVWNKDTGAVEEAVFAHGESPMPYIPGLLSFREIPIVVQALEQVGVKPDVIMVDGQGQAHPRKLGIAAHLGLLIDVPTIGVGKSKLVGEETEPGIHVGDKTPLMYKGEKIGYVLRTRNHVKPLYISNGNRITLEESVNTVLSCLNGYRLPEPTRLAHKHVNLVRTTGKGLPVSSTLALL